MVVGLWPRILISPRREIFKSGSVFVDVRNGTPYLNDGSVEMWNENCRPV